MDENYPHGDRYFLARYLWLKKELQLDDLKIPVYDEQVAVIQKTPYHQAELIFPTAFMNNPASMYGHTFLNLRMASHQSVLARSIDYSAQTQEGNGFVFAIKGLTGLYRGQFSLKPYYERIRTYNNISQRDIWEYTLNLSEEEIRSMVYHLIELNQTYSRYFFFDENCSFNLLFLLEVSRPSLQLTRQFKFMTVPVDTIRAVEQTGMVQEVRYRPSLATRLTTKTKAMSNEHRQVVKNLAQEQPWDPAPEVSPLEKQRVYDAAAELVQYDQSRGELAPSDYNRKYLKILKHRSQLGEGEPLKIVEPSQPLEGHHSRRFVISGGEFDGQESGWIGYRPVYHSLEDFSDGRIEGASVNFFSALGRWHRTQGHTSLKLERMDLVDLSSLAAHSEFLETRSFHVRTGWERMTMEGGQRSLLYRSQAGIGKTYPFAKNSLFALMLDGDGLLHGELTHNHAVGAGIRGYFTSQPLSWYRQKLEAAQLWYVLGDQHQRSEVNFIHKLKISRNVVLSAEQQWNRQYHADQWQWRGGFDLFF